MIESKFEARNLALYPALFQQNGVLPTGTVVMMLSSQQPAPTVAIAASRAWSMASGPEQRIAPCS